MGSDLKMRVNVSLWLYRNEWLMQDVGSMLGQRLRRWPSIEPTS